MSEKVILTQEQADAIELAISKHDVDVVMDGVTGRWVRDELTPLNRFFPSELAKALYIGYEVEPEFKVGDWVVTHSGSVRVVAAISTCGLVASVEDSFLDEKIKYLRHATPEEIAQEKERRWWAKHGRECLQFIKNDLVSYQDNSWGGLCTVSSNEYSKDVFGNRLVRLWNHRLKKDITIDADELRIICFAEDRKDV